MPGVKDQFKKNLVYNFLYPFSKLYHFLLFNLTQKSLNDYDT